MPCTDIHDFNDLVIPDQVTYMHVVASAVLYLCDQLKLTHRAVTTPFT